MEKMDQTVRKVTWKEPEKPKAVVDVKKTADTKVTPTKVTPAKVNPLMAAMTKSMQKRVSSQLKIEKERQEFIEAEKKRVADLQKAKVDSMKKITEYNQDVSTFADRQKKMLADLEDGKEYNKVLS